jgi:hypothetical protein
MNGIMAYEKPEKVLPLNEFDCPHDDKLPEGTTTAYCESSCNIEGTPKGCKYLSSCEAYQMQKRLEANHDKIQGEQKEQKLG